MQYKVSRDKVLPRRARFCCCTLGAGLNIYMKYLYDYIYINIFADDIIGARQEWVRRIVYSWLGDTLSLITYFGCNSSLDPLV